MASKVHTGFCKTNFFDHFLNFFLVLGWIEPTRLGITLPHEHMSHNNDVYLNVIDLFEPEIPWTLENIHLIKQFP